MVAGPWLLPGFLFGTDWPGPRRIDWPAELSSGAPVQALLAAISAALSAELATKLLVVSFLFIAALSAYRALPVGDFVPRAAASLIYTFNPFVYGRLHYGQFFLLAGYALLPWVASRVIRMIAQPNVRQAVILGLSLVLVSAFTLHLLLPAILLIATSTVAAAVVDQRRSVAYVLRLGRVIAICAGTFVVVGSYWLIPFLAGRSVEGKILAQLGSGDLAAYSSVPDPALGLFPNLVGLYGFWAEDAQRFPSLKLFVPYWYLALLALLVLAAIGVSSVMQPGSALREFRWWVASLLFAGTIALLLEAGIAEPHIAPIVRWLDAVFPPYRGMRDAGKWAALLAVVYAQLVPMGVIAIRNWLRGHPHGIPNVAGAAVSGLALALPLYYGNGLLFGMHGEIRPSMYPAGWYAADRIMAADPMHDRALFLPWHQYLRLSFVRNVNSVIVSPAPAFFSVPIVVSGDAEVGGIPPPNDPEQRAITTLVAAGDRADWAAALAARNIKYVLVAREVDSERFNFFDHQPGFARVAVGGAIALYRNNLLP